jgi:hypothetical protein
MKQSASADEAAAIAAAVERFLAETAAGVPGAGEEVSSPWSRAALLEGVGAQQMTIEDLEGGIRWLS